MELTGKQEQTLDESPEAQTAKIRNESPNRFGAYQSISHIALLSCVLLLGLETIAFIAFTTSAQLSTVLDRKTMLRINGAGFANVFPLELLGTVLVALEFSLGICLFLVYSFLLMRAFWTVSPC